MNTSERILQTVLAVPVGEYVKTADVLEHIRGLGHDVCARTIQRDLLACRSFGVIHDGTRRHWTRTRRLE